MGWVLILGSFCRVIWGLNYIDFGLFNLEIFIVVIDDGVFWAVGSDEVDVLG